MTDRYSQKSAQKGFRAVLILRPLSQLFSALAFVVLIRLLPEQQFGILALLLSSIAFIGLVLSLGIINTIQRFVPEYGKTGQFTRVKRIIHTGMILRLCSVLFVAALAYIFRDNLVKAFDLGGYETLAVPLALVILSHFQARILLVALPGLMLQRAVLMAQIAFAGCKFIGYLLLMQLGFGLEAVLWVDLIAYLVMLIIVTRTYVIHVLPLNGGPDKLGRAERKRVLRYGAFYNFNDVGILALGRDIDNIFLGALVNPMAVGAYAFATKFNDILMRMNPVSYFFPVIQPMFFTQDPIKDRARVGVLYSVLLKLGYIVVLPMFAGVSVLIDPIIQLLFSGHFLEFSWVVIAVLGFSAISSMGRPIGLVAQLYERADIMLYSKVFSLGNLALNVVLVPLYGLWGIIFATGCSIIAKDIFIWWFVRDIARPMGFYYFIGLSTIIWGSFIVVGRFVEAAIPSNILSIVVLVGMGLVWSLVHLHFCFRNGEERALIVQILQGKKPLAKLLGIYG